ncbi:MAG: 3(2),5-bisphosphate nucleotidase CysQ [Bacteroidota bacterium]|jgi:3'(2'), 5'-bisphosphate nucleotidase
MYEWFKGSIRYKTKFHTLAFVDALLEMAQLAGIAASAVLREYVTKSNAVTIKADDSPVTQADFAAHRIIVEHLASSLIPVVSEEDGVDDDYVPHHRFWLIDPLDGTKEFIRNRPDFTVNIALIDHGIPVLGVIAIPMRYEVWYGSAATGVLLYNEQTRQSHAVSPEEHAPRLVVSRSHPHPALDRFIEKERSLNAALTVEAHGAATKFCEVIQRQNTRYVRFSPCMIWDVAAGDALLRAANRKMVYFDGKTLDYRNRIQRVPPFIAG